MDIFNEEVEIKIEYFEKLETDPLTLVKKIVVDEKNNKNQTRVTSNNKIISGNDVVENGDSTGEWTESIISYNIGNEDAIEEHHRIKLNLNQNKTNDVLYYDYNGGCTEMDGESLSSDDDDILRTEMTWYKELDKYGKYICRFCELCYSTIQTLRFHVKTKHPDRAETLKRIIIKNKRNSKIKCHICKKSFKSINELKDHVKLYHVIENIQFSCHYCDASFTNETDLMQHIQYQEHEKISNKSTYICNVCCYRTLKKSHYKQHLNVHSHRKDKKCQYCDYSTNYSPNLKIHERIHVNDKPYTCSFKNCDYRCSAKSALRSHQLKHYREENMLYCDKCSYKTVYKQSLKKHCDSHARNSIRLKL